MLEIKFKNFIRRLSSIIQNPPVAVLCDDISGDIITISSGVTKIRGDVTYIS